MNSKKKDDEDNLLTIESICDIFFVKYDQMNEQWKKSQKNTRKPSKLNTNTKVPARLAGNKGTLQSNISI